MASESRLPEKSPDTSRNLRRTHTREGVKRGRHPGREQEMVGRFVAAVALATLIVDAPVDLAAQDAARPRILIPYFTPAEEVSDRFGKEISKKLQEIINRTHPLYVAIPEREIKDAVKNFDLNIEDLTCVQARQLSSHIDAAIVMCGSYTEEAGKRYAFVSEIWDMKTSEKLDITPRTVAEKDYEQAADHILGEFDTYVEIVRSRQFCAESQASQQWENALRQCDNALRLNPTANSVRYRRARILMEMNRLPEALEELETVIAADAVHAEAYESAGYVATQIAETEEDKLVARGYLEKYLELNPMNAGTRMTVAWGLAQAGDPVGAMGLISAGLELDAENVDLWEQYGNFAFNAAEQANTGGAGAELNPETERHYREAIDAYGRLYDARGAETQVGRLRNVMAAYLQLGDVDGALELGARATETHAEEPDIWSIYAQGLFDSGHLDESLEALNQLEAINPNYQNLAVRKATILLVQDQLEDAVALLTRAVASGRTDADAAGNILYNDAALNGYQKNDWTYTITRLVPAKQIEGVSSGFVSKADFLHGYSLYESAVRRQEPSTLASANATLPDFRRVITLMDGAAEYAASSGRTANVNEIVAAATQYVDIQEAIIRRGGV